MQTTIHIEEADLQILNQLGEKERLSREELIQKVITEYIQQYRTATRRSAFGIWKELDVDGLEYQRRIRSEWPD